MRCVVELGLDKASMREVGVRVNLDRTTVHHYFSTRGELIACAVERIATTYVQRLHAAVAKFTLEDRAHQLVEHLFGPQFHHHEMAVLIDELTVAGNRDPAILKEVASIYRAVEKVILAEINTSYPKAAAKHRLDIAYTISQLAEGCSVFASLGFESNRRLAAYRVSLQLLDTLE